MTSKDLVMIHFGALGFLNPTENEQILKDRDKVLKDLTALEIIKEKEVNASFLRQLFRNKGWVRYETYQDYLRKDYDEFKRAYLSVSLFPLTQDEFDLLKEVLGND